jgi:PAS domain S-box-containing protein
MEQEGAAGEGSVTTGSTSPSAEGANPEPPAFSLDAQLRYTDFNDAHADLMRSLYGAEIAVGDRIEDHMPVDVDRETALANLRRALAGERVVAGAYSGDGEERRYFDVTHTPVRDAGGAVVGVSVNAYDASDRVLVERRLEEERQRYRSRDIERGVEARAGLAESERVFRTVADFTYDWEWWRAPDGTLLYVSPSCERVTGYPADEFIADPDLLLRITHPEDRERMLDHYTTRRSTVSGDVAHDLEYRIRRADGGERWIGHRCTRVTGPDGSDLGVRASNRDITDRKTAEHGLREREAENALLLREQETRNRWLHALVAAMRDAASRLDMEDLLADIARHAADSVGAAQAVIYEFDAERDVLITRSLYGSGGRCRIESPGDEFDIAETPSDRDILASDQVVVETLSDEMLAPHMRGLMRELGDKTLVNVPFRYGGEPLGLLVLIETEEERVFAQEELEYLRAFGEQTAIAIHNARLYAAAQQAREELAALNAELEERVEQRTAELRAVNEEMEAFAYSVSHDLRAPLRAIDGFSLVLMEDEAEGLSAVGRGNLARVRTAAQRMGQLIDALLALSRLGRKEVRRSTVDLSTLALQVLERLAERDPTRRVVFSVQPGCEVVSDLELLEVVLDNLCGNAWKFTSGNAEAHIAFGVRTIAGESAYFVEDDGAGFDPEYADKLFQPFQRLHTDEQFAGTGIGLATVRRVINRLGGWCWAEGKVGAGATFFFTLAGGPAVPAGAPGPVRPQPPAPPA